MENTQVEFLKRHWLTILLALCLLISLGYNSKFSRQKSNLQYEVNDLEDKVNELEDR
jgi:hypothetical protein